MFHKVREVTPLENYRLFVEFDNGERKIYHIKPLLAKWDPFKDLVTVQGLFDQVKVDPGGYGISWNDYIDLSCDELYYYGKNV
ncbi:hypothetical protein HMPREF3191_00540 [Veillonellaceae bacterium DNF00626]|nr:hypothetical protein HMPREF3191_00540 [Veillonellaceae bacterium DNF00626]